ncbi:MAG: DUF1836 domain-containing protein [Clostridia bacterium]|nr:DUF1836 domain-containing protein [Clostridia bacterium]
MNLEINDAMIPGTRLKKRDMGNVTGLEFLSKVFYISEGVMLSQIREVSGIDGSTLQNWTKRGWVANARLKKYNIDQVAHILIINMLRSCIQLDHIAFLLQYINGKIDDTSDDIIRDSVLYDYICRILEALTREDVASKATIKDVINRQIADYEEAAPGARDRLSTALEIIVTAYYAALIKKSSDEMLAHLMSSY